MTTDIGILINQYLDGTLPEQEAEYFAKCLEQDEQTRNLLRDNLILHFLLNERSSRQRSVQEGRNPVSQAVSVLPIVDIVFSGDKPENEPEPSWEELVRLQNAERPIANIGNEDKVEIQAQKANGHTTGSVFRLAKKCFYPSRQNLEESIAPVVTYLTVLFVLLVATGYWIESSVRLTSIEPMTLSIRVKETVDAVWQDNTESFKRGQQLESGIFNLKSGLVQLEMDNGTALILEGPTELVVNDGMNAYCRSGRISATVPEAGHGYKIVTPFGSVIDRGTEFFLNVTKEDSFVQTVKGQVDLISTDRSLFSLLKGEGVKMNQSRKMEPVRSAHIATEFIASHVFEHKVREKTNKVLAEKAAWDQKLDSEPGLLARFHLENSRSNIIKNQSLTGREFCPHARVNGTRVVSGSLSGTNAIAFSRTGDRIDFTMNKTVQNLTMITMVRIGAQQHLGSVLFSSRDHESSAGTITWQLTKFGFMQAQIMPQNHLKESVYDSAPVFSSRGYGTWMALAVVFDSKSKRIRFYADSVLISTVPWKNPLPIVIKEASLGDLRDNITATDRFFNGAMEEFVMYDYAVPDSEIRTLMKERFQ